MVNVLACAQLAVAVSDICGQITMECKISHWVISIGNSIIRNFVSVANPSENILPWFLVFGRVLGD